MIRKGAARFDLYNEAELVFLYDASSVSALREMRAAHVLGGSDPARENPEEFRRIEAERIIVAYGLYQDDSVSVEVAVGAALTTAEKKGLPWMPVQRSLLRLPSGKLRIDTYNTFRFGDFEPDEPGGELDVPAGEYVVAVHRVWMDQLRHQTDQPYGGPGEVVTLTRVRGKSKVEARALLPFEMPKPKLSLRKAGGGTGPVGTWTGMVAEPVDVEPQFNMDEATAKDLGLRFGQALFIRIGDRAFRAIYTGPLHAADYWAQHQAAHLAERPDVCIAYLALHPKIKILLLTLARPKPAPVFIYADLGLGKISRGDPVSLEILPQGFDVRPKSNTTR